MSLFCQPWIVSVSVLIALASANVGFATDPVDHQDILSAIKSDRLNDQQFERLTQFVRPKASEEKWRETAWIPSIHDGRKMSVAQNKPVFLWAMNGDPLGCV